MNPIQICCPTCFAANRVPAERLSDKPQCGKCKRGLFLQKAQELNSGNVAATLAKNDIPVLVDCWAPWCGPCKTFAPIFEQAAAQFEPTIRFAKLNTEAVPSIAQRWNIRSIPTLILFKGGKEIQRMSGALPLPQLQQWLRTAGVL
jgi:thioredoxin 2